MDNSEKSKPSTAGRKSIEESFKPKAEALQVNKIEKSGKIEDISKKKRKKESEETAEPLKKPVAAKVAPKKRVPLEKAGSRSAKAPKPAPKAPEKAKPLSFKEKLQRAGIEINLKRRVVKLKKLGADRKFITTKKFIKKLKALDSPEKIKLECYKVLLKIVTGDRSINSNRWRVKEFRGSNARMVQEIVRLENLLAPKPQPQPQLIQATARRLTIATLRFGKGKNYEIKSNGDVIITNEKASLDKIYKELAKRWGKTPEAPFTLQEFKNANKGKLNKGQKLTLPYKGLEALPKTVKKTPAKALPKAPAKPLSVDQLKQKVKALKKPEKAKVAPKKRLPALSKAVDLKKYEQGYTASPICQSHDGNYWRVFIEKKTDTADILFGSSANGPWKNPTKSTPDYTAGSISVKDNNGQILYRVFLDKKGQIRLIGSINTGMRGKKGALLNPAAPKIIAPIPPREKTTKKAIVKPKKAPEKAKPRETLNKNQFKSIKIAKKNIKEAFQKEKNVWGIISKLTEEGRKLRKEFPVEKFNIKLAFSPIKAMPLIWSSREYRNGGFGERTKLISLIYDIKRAQLGGSKTPEYARFHALSATKGAETRKKQREKEKMRGYFRDYKALTSADYALDSRIGRLDSDVMERHWSKFKGHKIVENIMAKYPFGITAERARGLSVKMICKGSNSKVSFEDIFSHMNGFPLVNNSLIPAKFLKNSDAFLDEFNRIRALDDPSEEENKRFEHMATKILFPCLKLLEAIANMSYPPEGIEEKKVSQTDILQKGLAKGQENTIKAIMRLFQYTENPSSAWDRIVGWLGGAAGEITMSNINGKTFKVDEGMFRRHYNPYSAITALFNKSGMHTLDKNGKKIMNEAKLVAEINRILKLGYRQLKLQKAFREKGKIPELYQLPSLAAIAHMEKSMLSMFQMGFILDKINQSEKNAKEAAKGLIEDAPPGMKEVLERFKGKVPLAQLYEIRKILGGVYVHIHKAGDSYKFTGAGFNKKFTLSNGQSIEIGVGGISQKPGIVAGFALNISLYNQNGTVISLTPGVSTLGIGIGLRGSHDIGGVVDFSWGGGTGLGWGNGNLVLGAGGAISISYERALISHQKALRTKEKLKGSGLDKQLWEKWKTLSNEKKWELVTRLPIYSKIREIMGKNKEITKDMIINMVSLYIEQVEGNIYDAMRATLTPVGITIGTVAIAAGPLGLIGGLKFQIGSATVFVPHLSEESRVLNLISNAAMKAKMKKFFKDLRNGKLTPVYKERTSRIYYRPGSKLGLGIRIKRNEVDFSNLEKGTMRLRNKALESAEMRLVRIDDKNNELVIDNDDDKDMEIHIDPELHNLGLVLDKKTGRIFIKGNIDDLIIIRERFNFPNSLAEGQASLRDVITIRQKASLAGKRDRLWIEDHEAFYLEKIAGQVGYNRQRGANYESRRSPIIVAEDYLSGKIGKHTAESIAYYKRARVSPEKRITLEQTKKWQGQVGKMRKALGSRVEKSYKKEITVSPEILKPQLAKIYKRLQDELVRPGVIEDPLKIAALIARYRKELYPGNAPLSDKEMNMAVTYMIDRWFVTLNPKKIYRTLKLSRAFTRKKYLEEFEAAGKKLKIKSNPERMVDMFMDDIYGHLFKILKQKPPVDYQKVMKLGKGLLTGEILVSGTRGWKDLGKRKGKTRELAKTSSFEMLGSRTQGFLEGPAGKNIGKTYDLNSGNPLERDLARVMLEIASPIPQDNLELLRSPLALKILGLGAYRLMVEEAGGGGSKQYSAMIELAKNPTPENFKKYSRKIARFKKFLERVRESQISGKPLEITTTQGIIIRLNMGKTKIRSGAYSKCGNASYSVNEGGTIQILRPKRGVYAGMTTVNAVADPRLTKMFLSFSLFGGFSSAPAAKTKPPAGKRSAQGGGESPTGSTTNVSTGPGSRGVAAGSHNPDQQNTF